MSSKKNEKRNIFITVLISFLLLIFVGSLSYIIYCYGFYDKKQDNEILEYYSSFKFDELYEEFYIVDATYLEKAVYDNVTDLIFNKINLEKIYNSYYQDTDIFEDKEEFIKKYYFRYKSVTVDDIDYKYEGKTTLFSRREASILGINVENGYEEDSYFGILKDISFVTKGITSFKIDNKEISCNNECKIDYIFGGVHEVEYELNGISYYGLVNIKADGETIYVMEIDNLVPIFEKVSLDLETFDSAEVKGVSLDVGLYGLSECRLESGCPSTNYTYIALNSDGTCTYYFYITLDKAGDTYNGTYKIENGFLKLFFESHTYSVFDYDTKQKTDIQANTDVKMTFKINDGNSFSNGDYSFLRKA